MIIGHFDRGIWFKGGIANYIRRISNAQRVAGHTVKFFSNDPCAGADATEQPILVRDDIELFQQAEALNLDLLHLHGPLAVSPPSHLPVIRTLHGHSPYCPSGSKYLQRWNRPCDRSYSLHGCLWGHLVDYCGSVRPQRIADNFQRLSREMEILQNIPVITVSHFLKSQMVDAGYPIDSIHVLHLFSPEIANISPPPPTGVPRFIFLGRLVPLKGLEWLLRSIRQVQVPIHLDIAGEGPQESKMKHLVQRLQLEDRVTFHGWVDQDRVNQLIQSARALIFPSLWHEPGGTVAFEAMSQSRAVIMSRVGGMPEVVLSETNGLLIEPNNILELAQCIEKLALDWSFAKELGEGGRKLAATKFTFDQHMDQLIQLYKQTTVSLPHLTGQL